MHKQYPDRQVIVLWRDDKPEAGLAWLIFCPSRNRNWRMTQPFGCNGSGTVISWSNGALKALKPACGAVMLALNPADDLTSKQCDLMEQVSRDREFSSQHAAMQAFNLQVDSVRMDLTSCRATTRG